MNKGLFITFEGCDGVGKTTQIRLLEKVLFENDIKYTLTREPGGTNISEKIRDIILDKENKEMVWKTEALLYAASRAQHVEELIKPELSKGKLVLCDRYFDSTLAYQGYARGISIDELMKLNSFAMGGTIPDITFLLDQEIEVAKSRMKNRNLDRMEQEDKAFKKRVRAGFLELAKQNPERIILIRGKGNIKAIHREIVAHLKKKIKGLVFDEN